MQVFEGQNPSKEEKGKEGHSLSRDPPSVFTFHQAREPQDHQTDAHTVLGQTYMNLYVDLMLCCV